MKDFLFSLIVVTMEQRNNGAGYSSEAAPRPRGGDGDDHKCRKSQSVRSRGEIYRARIKQPRMHWTSRLTRNSEADTVYAQ